MGVERELLAKLGALLITGALIAPASLSAATAQASTVVFASAVDVATQAPAADEALLDASVAPPELLPRGATWSGLGGGEEAAPVPEPEPLSLDGVILASWYGPGFFGNRTACGQTYSEDIIGVAHRTLACGTKVRVTAPSGLTFTVPVIDRGPYVAGRSLDLSSALKDALGCTDLCRVRMVVIR